MPNSASCAHTKKINDATGDEQGHNCEGYVIRWKVWGVSGRYLEDCECECHKNN